MDKEFKFAVGFIVVLAVVSTVLLEALAGIHVFSRAYVSGFAPFLLLLVPYILFSSKVFTDILRDFCYGSLLKKVQLPAHLMLVYSISSLFSGNFQWVTFGRLAAWSFIPVMVMAKDFEKDETPGLREAVVACLLWLPIEFGWLAGFDLTFTKDIQVPGLAFAAPILGLYLFVVLRDLPDVGYTFMLNRRDFATAALGLVLLAVLLIPLGTTMGFIRATSPQLSFFKAVEYLLGIYFLVAIPEELLFRGIFQNLLHKTLPASMAKGWGLLIAAVLFGFSHMNNFSPPDWRYVFLASIAGLVYGAVYLRTGKTTASALVHCGVNFCWAVFFPETAG